MKTASPIQLITCEDESDTTDDGQLTTDDGQLTTDDGQLTTDDRQLTSEDGQLTTDNGQRTTDDTWTELPDLILIDGGVGQLNGALEVLRDLRFEHIPAVGVVKGPKRDRFDLLLPGATELIVLGRDSAALRLVQTIDEETDRFAKHYHRGLRAKSAIKSTLDDIPGIGPKRKRALLKAFGSLDGIRAASIEQLSAIQGMTRKSAEDLKGLL